MKLMALVEIIMGKLGFEDIQVVYVKYIQVVYVKFTQP
jgi:hypothetical protein